MNFTIKKHTDIKGGYPAKRLQTPVITVTAIIMILIIAVIMPVTASNPEEDELAGIKLGFTTDQVKKLMGTPPAVSELGDEDQSLKQIIWEYKEKGIKILFKNDLVEVIILEEPCSLATPRGLKIGDNWKKALDIYRYCGAYVQNLGYEIGIVFTLNGEIKLSIAIPSDREEIYKISLWREE